MLTTTTKPIIGITLDSEESGEYSSFPWYALRQNYFESVCHFGAVAIALPHEPQIAEAYLDLIDGLIITGGNFDIDPKYYGSDEIHQTVKTKNKRTLFETSILKKCLKTKKPILGICGGEQLLNVVLGGTLIQHIPDEVTNCLEHEQKTPKNQPSHDISIVPGTLLHNILGLDKIAVNSTHHQAVKTIGKNVVINCQAPDGVIEGIEYTEHPFCLGVEWHPEYLATASDNKIIQAFIHACGR